MDRMSVWSILFVSYPEIILISITALSIAGYRAVLDFKSKENIKKILLTTTLMVAVSTITRTIIPLATLNSLILIIMYTLILIYIYRCKLLPCLLGVLLSVVVLIIGEAVFVSFILKAYDLSLQSTYDNDMIRILLSIPVRLLQLITVIAICKIKSINLSLIKLSIDEWIHVVLFFLMIVSSMVSIETGLRNIHRDFKTMLNLIIYICIAVVFSSWLIYSVFKIRKKSIYDEKIRDFELDTIRQLLSEGCKPDHIIELIDRTLNERRSAK